MKLFLRILFIINVIVVVITVTGFLASYIDPNKVDLFQFIGILMPFFILITFLFGAFWGVLRHKRFWLSALCLLLGWGQIGRFVGFHFNQNDQSKDLSILSFNSQSYNRSDHLKVFLENNDLLRDCEIICLQEISEEQLPLFENNWTSNQTFYYKGKMILSAYPFQSQGKIQFDESVNGCLWVDLLIKGKIIRVYNIHLRSNNITKHAEEIMDNIELQKKRTWKRIYGMFYNYRKASRVRVDHARKIMQHIEQSPYPVIVAGDFNDSPFSHTYRIFNRSLVDHFKKKGLGIGTTYAGALPGLKIDYIFADENFQALSYQIIKTNISDHFPVLSRMNFIN